MTTVYFTFNGDSTLVYPDVVSGGAVLVAEPGNSYELDEAPDPRWSPQAPETTPEAPVAASEPVSEVSTPETETEA